MASTRNKAAVSPAAAETPETTDTVPPEAPEVTGEPEAPEVTGEPDTIADVIAAAEAGVVASAVAAAASGPETTSAGDADPSAALEGSEEAAAAGRAEALARLTSGDTSPEGEPPSGGGGDVPAPVAQTGVVRRWGGDVAYTVTAFLFNCRIGGHTYTAFAGDQVLLTDEDAARGLELGLLVPVATAAADG